MRATSLFLLLLCCLSIFAEDTSPGSDATSGHEAVDLAKVFEDEAQPFLQMYCADCHAGDEPEAGVYLDLEEAPDVALDFPGWTVIWEKIEGGEMPPEDAEQPSDEERKSVIHWIESGLANFDCNKQPIEPRTTIRRLNRAEYNNAIRDLFGVNIRPADEFPNDEVGEGFDNIGSVLALPPLLMEKYLDAAKLVTDEIDKDKKAWQKTFGKLPKSDDIKTKQVRQAVRNVARRAYRTPIDDDELNRLMALYRLAKDNQLNNQDAALFVVQGVLASPNFLFRLEEDPRAIENETSKQLDSHAVASRLAFFLWSSVPDEKLNLAADRDQLKEPQQVAAQARRMMKDEKSRAFIENFVGQWLQLRLLSASAPDPGRFPQFNETLRAEMSEETYRYVHELLKRNGSVLELLNSDYSYLNESLAKHYGIDGIQGNKFRKVSFKDGRRGGVLTHGSVLTLTSNPTRTSPVKRGKWILDNVLGTPPPPPPPDVPELEEGNELLGTLRERMKEHRENPNCAVCHRKMDVLGFGFENFDAVGGWRDKEGRHEIDVSGELPDGSTFKTPAELREILIEGSTDFTNCLTRKLLTYALGRSLSLRDKCAVDDIVKHVETHDHKFSELISAIVTSDTFRYSGYRESESN